MIPENLTTWLGHPVADYEADTPIKADTFYRFRVDWDAEVPIAELFAGFLAEPAVGNTTGIVIGAWFGDDSSTDSSELVQLLVGARHALPKLEAIFFGDIISEENEMSWINQTDVSPLFAAYPNLKHFVVRGGNGLSLGGKMRLESLQSLVVETGGMPATVLREALSLELPNLEKLELWLGTDEYGWDGSVVDLQPLLSGALFPKLTKLGLRNSDMTDEIAEGLVNAPVIQHLEALDLSMGTLTDKGAEHLLKCENLKRLKCLDLHHHYCTDDMVRRLQSAFPGVNLEEQEKLDEYGPYVAVGE